MLAAFKINMRFLPNVYIPTFRSSCTGNGHGMTINSMLYLCFSCSSAVDVAMRRGDTYSERVTPVISI